MMTLPGGGGGGVGREAGGGVGRGAGGGGETDGGGGEAGGCGCAGDAVVNVTSPPSVRPSALTATRR